MNARCLVSLVLLAATSIAGCDADEAGFGSAESTLLRPGSGGIWLNTSSIGSKEFSEFDLGGQLHAGVRLLSVSVQLPNDQWAMVSSRGVVDGQLQLKLGATTYTGAALVGSRWMVSIPNYDYGYDDHLDAGQSDNGVRNVELWISAYAEDASNQGRYTFETLDEEGKPTFICDADAQGEHAAIPIKDVSVDSATGDMTARPSTVYLACTSGAVGKAIVWGYKPWQRSLPEFELASRVVRADYCADGVSWTETGTSLQVRDSFEINDFLRAEDPNEVVWTTGGAACLGQPRNANYKASQVTCGGQPLPSCADDVSLETYPDSMFWTKLDAPQ